MIMKSILVKIMVKKKAKMLLMLTKKVQMDSVQKIVEDAMRKKNV